MNTEFDTRMLDAVVPLVEVGFALHWLVARAKRPVEENWSDAPVATIEKLRASHRPGYNCGIRLGEPSRLPSGDYLHVLDIDIRVADCVDEAWERLAELFPGVDITALPLVISGSGGASRHIYLALPQPFYGRKLAVSEGKHRHYDADRGRDVWSYDWEIELFGTGKQVVLPPSIHPVTREEYLWERPFDFDAIAFGGAPLIPVALIEAIATATTETYGFETRDPLTFKPGQMEQELDELPIEHIDDYHDWVMLGQALHHQTGASEDGLALWIKQSRRSGKFAGEKECRKKWRGFGRSRRQPVTMATVRQWFQEARVAGFAAEFDDVDDFDHVAEVPADSQTPAGTSDLEFDDEDITTGDTPSTDEFAALLDGGAASTLADDLAALDLSPDEKKTAEALSWVSLLDYSEKGGLVGTLHNAELLLKHDPRFAGLPQLNDLTHEVVQRTAPGTKSSRKSAVKPTKQLTGPIWYVKDERNGDMWSEDRDFSIRSIIEAPKTQGGWGMKITDRDLKAAIAMAANENPFHPVREYLNAVKWDGIERCSRLWVDFVGSPDDAYHRDTARIMLIAAVTRIFEPGHKFDYATILEGLQGKRKSTLIETLGRRWFTELDGDFHNAQQMVELMQGAWIMEIPELTGFSRADVRSIKAFISRKSDKVRLAYAKRAGVYPRQCIFLGSTNDREYLRDDTGGRRFWPIECKLPDDVDIDITRLEGQVDQLWAEAVALYREMRAAQPRGTLPLYLMDSDAQFVAKDLQESRRVETPSDTMAGMIELWLDRPIETGDFGEADGDALRRDTTCTVQIWIECLGRDKASFKTQEQALIGAAMRKVKNWQTEGKISRVRGYGKQRVWRREGTIGEFE